MRAGQAPPVSPAVRVTTVAAVVVVAAVAAVVSFSHMQEVAERAGEGWRSWLIPASVDGLIVASSMVLLVRRRAGLPGGWLAWTALLGGVLASLACNIAAAEPTVTARLIAAWPPLAFAGAFELLLQQRRSSHATLVMSPEPITSGSASGVPEPVLTVSPASRPAPPPVGSPVAPVFRVGGVPATPRPVDHPPVDRPGDPSPTPRPLVDQDSPEPLDADTGDAAPEELSPTAHPPVDPLVDQVVALVDAAPPGRPPGRRIVARELDVSEYRASQLLAHVAGSSTPAAPPPTNGAAREGK